MEDRQLIAPIEGTAVSALADWASLWTDLLHVEMTLLARKEMRADAAHLFARRALWEAAAISYGRTSIGGRRQQRLTDLIEARGPEGVECHQDIMAWRNQHVAHRVDERRERIEVGAIIDPVAKRVKRVNVRVAPVLGPEDEADDLAQRLELHVKVLRDRIWEEHFGALEQEALQSQIGCIDDLIVRAKPFTPSRAFAIDINPTGRA
jgi:hypothetical protein